ANMAIRFSNIGDGSIDPHKLLRDTFSNPTFTLGGASPAMKKLLNAGINDPTATSAKRSTLVSHVIGYATKHALYAPVLQGVGGLVATTNVAGLKGAGCADGSIADISDAYVTNGCMRGL